MDDPILLFKALEPYAFYTTAAAVAYMTGVFIWHLLKPNKFTTETMDPVNVKLTVLMFFIPFINLFGVAFIVTVTVIEICQYYMWKSLRNHTEEIHVDGHKNVVVVLEADARSHANTTYRIFRSVSTPNFVMKSEHAVGDECYVSAIIEDEDIEHLLSRWNGYAIEQYGFWKRQQFAFCDKYINNPKESK